MEAYRDFAYVYDEFMDETPYEEWCERIHSLIQKYGVSKPERGAGESCMADAVQLQRSAQNADQSHTLDQDTDAALASERNLIVDLGCGTGTLTELLYEKGYDCIGVDVSEEMLDIAMQKREESGREILYLLQDMRELELYCTAGTMVSVCDSVNYILEEEELIEVFSLVNNYLYPGGIFIFDFNTDYKYREVIGDTTIAENREDCSFIWENYYDPDSGINEYDLTIFVKEEDDTFRRFTENHFQKGYSVDTMIKLAEASGMKILEVRDADTGEEVSDTTERAYMVLGEQGKELLK